MGPLGGVPICALPKVALACSRSQQQAATRATLSAVRVTAATPSDLKVPQIRDMKSTSLPRFQRHAVEGLSDLERVSDRKAGPAAAGRGGIGIDHTERLFYQAEDGIRDLTVTGVQTCALPI